MEAIQMVPCRLVVTYKVSVRSQRQHGSNSGVRKHHLRVIQHPLPEEA